MANMSYCRYQNTRSDLEDCVEAMENEGLDGLSAEEKRAADDMQALAVRYICAYRLANPDEDGPCPVCGEMA